jgi:hypothetical protein
MEKEQRSDKKMRGLCLSPLFSSALLFSILPSMLAVCSGPEIQDED